MKEVIFHKDILPELIEYLDSSHAAFFMRIDKSYSTQLDKDWLRWSIQKKRSIEAKKVLIV